MPAWLPFLGVLLAFELAGDVVAKEFALHGGAWRMTLAASLVVVGNISWQLMLRNGMELGRGGLLFAVGVAVGVLLIGTFGYGETLTIRQLAGALFGLVAIVLLTA